MKKLALMTLATTLASSFALAEVTAPVSEAASPAAAVAKPSVMAPPNMLMQPTRMSSEQRRVDFLRKRAKSYTDGKLYKWEEDATGATLDLVKKCSEARKKAGELMTQMADAIEKKDAAAVTKLEADIAAAEGDIRSLEAEKQGAKRIADLDKTIAQFPEAKELVPLRAQLQSNTEEFVKVSKETIALNDRRMKNIKEASALNMQINNITKQAKMAKKGAK